ncbi:MAG: MBL fold metallo-hydrolase [Anaerolineae bacterium]|nr:MBL fold metallo-hydrolase [Anaerolineae bacterium]
MRVTLWGVRGSLASPGPDTGHYGGNTACVEVRGTDDTVLVLDAGTGIRRLGMLLPPSVRRVDLLLTHLHMDHIQGLGFFTPLYDPAMEVHIYGPASTTLSLQTRLARYLSPPLFPVRLRELPCKLTLHEVPCGDFEVGEFHITNRLICHPGPTVGYRIENARAAMAYFPDHEPALGLRNFPLSPDWTSGYPLAANVDLLIHDAQYSAEEYLNHVGWGHSSLEQAFKFTELAQAKHLVPFHHDPSHTDDYMDRFIVEAIRSLSPRFDVTAAKEGAVFAQNTQGRFTVVDNVRRTNV